MSKKVNKILGLINEAHKEKRTELSSKLVELSVSGLTSDLNAVSKTMQKFEVLTKQSKQKVQDLISESKELLKEVQARSSDINQALSKLDKIQDEAYDQALEYEDIAMKMQAVDLDFKEPMTLAQEALEINQQALRMADSFADLQSDLDSVLSKLKSL